MGNGFNLKIKMNATNKILKVHGLDENGRVQKRIITTAERLMNPFIPFQSGNLRRLKVYPNPSKIKYISPYAHYHYKGLKAKGVSRPKGIKRKILNEKLKYHTAGTGPEWDKLMMEKKGKELIQDVQNYVKRG